jgi:hypothetical protein
MKRWRDYAKAVMTTAVLGAALTLVAVPRASARDFDDRGRCQERVEKAEAKLNQAIWQHGRYSRQAERRRYELVQARQNCWSRTRSWWDAREHRWRTDHDWDRDDWRDRR